MPRLTFDRALILPVMLAGAAALTACNALPAPGYTPEAPAAAELSVRPAPPELAGTRWQVETMGGVAVVAGSEPHILFAEDGAISGTTGCNRFFGRYRQRGSVLEFSGIGMTRMACMDERVMAQESAFAAILQGVAALETDAMRQITIRGADGAGLTARPLPAEGEEAGNDPALLTGAEWRVEDLNRGGVIDNSRLSVTFGPNGRLTGSAQCNRLSGTYRATGKVISFGPVTSTLMACVNEALNHQDNKFTEALRGDMDWRLTEDGALELTREGGHRVLLRR